MNASLSRFMTMLTGGSRRRQVALIAGFLAIALGAALTAWFVLRPSYEVLFRDLGRQDAANIAAELEKEKIPFRYDEEHATILVPAGDNRATRLKLMSRDLRLQGIAGLELFNNSDLGLTEFAQKVNYQRALQGELARTIMSLDEIELARVHLTLPDSSIFRRDASRPKASVAVFLKDGRRLEPDTVRGIRRLVAASVPELEMGDVSVLDERGAPENARGGDADEPALQLKHAIEEDYKARILAQVGAMLGAGRVSVSVDATLDLDQVRSTREQNVTRPLASQAEESATAAGSPRNQTMPDSGLPPLPPPGQFPVAAPGGTHSEHQVENVVKAPGAIKRLTIGIVFDRPLGAAELSRLTSLVSASVGLNPARGDVISTFVREEGSADASSKPLATSANAPFATDGTTTVSPVHDGANVRTPDTAPPVLESLRRHSTGAAFAMALLLIALFGTGLLWKRFASGSRHSPVRLTAAQREEIAAKLRALLTQEGQFHE